VLLSTCTPGARFCAFPGRLAHIASAGALLALLIDVRQHGRCC